MHFSFTSRWGRPFSAAVLLALVGMSATRAEIIDRVEIAIGQHAVTESQIEEEVRVTDLLNHAPVKVDAAARRRAAEQLVVQYLIAREIEVSHFPVPKAGEVDAYENRVRDDFGGADELARALAAYGLTQTVLKEHLAVQLRTLAFTRFRFPTDEALNRWITEARRRVKILYVDTELQ